MPCTPDQFQYATQREPTKFGNERATRDRVLDELTLKTLNKLINTDNLISHVEGCLSSGKEANVYHCFGFVPDSDPQVIQRLAVKVYATTTNVFKGRQHYMQGWHNMNGVRQGRQMIERWAGNEFSHLQRMTEAGIQCPKPVAHRDNIVVMSLLGTIEGEAYPRLQHATVKSVSEWCHLYKQLLCLIRRMYKVSRLVHGDLSEYNILHHRNTLYIIDVSQSLEHSNPESLNMLRMDIKNVNTFFRRKKVDVLNEVAIFDFITTDDAPLDLEQMKKTIEKLSEEHEEAQNEEAQARAEVDESAFRHKFIPRSLNEAYDIEVNNGVENVDRSVINHLLARDEYSSRSDEGSETENENGLDSDDISQRRPRGKKHMSKDEKHAHKMIVKETKRAKRKEKMPKKQKKATIADRKSVV